MCGRFVLLSDLSVIGETFHIDVFAESVYLIGDRFPGQDIAAIILNGHRRLVSFQWGLIPRWAKDPAPKKLINARGETLAVKPSFRDAFRKRRCLIVADGFYEWDRLSSPKRMIYFQLKSGQPFGMAGLYEIWKPPVGPSVCTCTIVTTAANELIKTTHDRMPVIVQPDRENLWLGADEISSGLLKKLLVPSPSEGMVRKYLPSA